MSKHNSSRRKFIKAAAYTAPVVMTLKASPSFAKGGSYMNDHVSCKDGEREHECKSSGFIKQMHKPKEVSGFSKFLKSFLKIFGL